MNLVLVNGQLDAAFLARLEPTEAATVAELSARDDTKSLLVADGEKVVAYAVFGFDDQEIITVFAARAMNHFLAKCAMQAFFGAAQVLGTPLRVHTEKLRAMARMMGAESALATFDCDGVPMGVFNVQ